ALPRGRGRPEWSWDTSCLQSLVQILQTAHRPLGSEFQCHADSLTTGQGRGGVHLVLQRIAANGIGVRDRLTTFGGVDHQTDLVVLDHVDDVRTTFGDLVHPTYRQTGGLDDLGSSGGGDDL